MASLRPSHARFSPPFGGSVLRDPARIIGANDRTWGRRDRPPRSTSVQLTTYTVVNCTSVNFAAHSAVNFTLVPIGGTRTDRRRPPL